MTTITSTHITDFIDELALLLESDISCSEALQIIRQENRVLQKLIDDISADIENNMSLADSLAKYPQYFKPFLIDILRNNGEASLTRIAQYQEAMDVSTRDLTKKIFKSSTYTMFLIFITVIITTILLTYVVPVFAEMFSSFGGELPGLTQFVMNLSDFFVNNWIFIIAGIFILAGLIVTNWRLLTLYIPPFSGLYHKIVWIRCLRTCAFMLAEGASIIQALNTASQTVENPFYAKRLSKIQGDLSTELKGIFPEKIIHGILVGNKTNKLDKLLIKLADRYTKQLNLAIEPAIKIYTLFVTILVGIIIGLLVISMYLPIFTMGGQM